MTETATEATAIPDAIGFGFADSHPRKPEGR